MAESPLASRAHNRTPTPSPTDAKTPHGSPQLLRALRTLVPRGTRPQPGLASSVESPRGELGVVSTLRRDLPRPSPPKRWDQRACGTFPPSTCSGCDVAASLTLGLNVGARAAEMPGPGPASTAVDVGQWHRTGCSESLYHSSTFCSVARRLLSSPPAHTSDDPDDVLQLADARPGGRSSQLFLRCKPGQRRRASSTSTNRLRDLPNTKFSSLCHFLLSISLSSSTRHSPRTGRHPIQLDEGHPPRLDRRPAPQLDRKSVV